MGYDFVKRLLGDPTRLDILGDGRQSKSYIHVDDVIEAVLTAYRAGKNAYEVYKVATGDNGVDPNIALRVIRRFSKTHLPGRFVNRRVTGSPSRHIRSKGKPERLMRDDDRFIASMSRRSRSL